MKVFKADATIFASGGPGIIFGKSTNSVINTGSAAASLYLQGAIYANGEFIQIHPTAIPGDDKLRLMSESAVVKVVAFGHTRTENHGISLKRNTLHMETLYHVISQHVKYSMFV